MSNRAAAHLLLVAVAACQPPGGADGALVDDFVIKQGRNAIHILNAPSPGATASLAIGRQICEMAEKNFDLRN